MRLFPGLLLLVHAVLFAQTLKSAPIVHFTHGQWFDGNRFVARDFYAEGGVLTEHPSERRDIAEVDLHGGFVVPPYGDAHEHNFNSLQPTPAVAAAYLRDGIFYAQGMTDLTSAALQVVAAHMVDTPTTPDVTYAHGGLTAPNGHPKDVYDSIALGFFYPATPEQLRAVLATHATRGDAYWEIGSAGALDAQWPKILAAHPDLIKVYLSDSEHFKPATAEDPRFGKGLDPALIPLITARAHAAHLRVAAHIDTAADFHVAVAGGVDILAHLPGYGFGASEASAPYRLDDADIALAARHHCVMIPTASLAAVDPNRSSPKEVAAAERRKTLQHDNLERLKAAGIPILAGSDHYGQDSLVEADYLQSSGLWTNLEMLRLWSVTTPQSIFPGRRLGELRPGYEASFLVLSADPLVSWPAAHAITDRWKGGVHIVLNPAPSQAAAATLPPIPAGR